MKLHDSYRYGDFYIDDRIASSYIDFDRDTVSGVPLRTIGMGRDRYVYSLSPYLVLKIDPAGDANLAEHEYYARAPIRVRSRLAPIFSCSPTGLWLVMRRADRVLGPDEADALSYIFADWPGEAIYDLEPRNIGVFKKTLKIIDYAENVYTDGPDYDPEF